MAKLKTYNEFVNERLIDAIKNPIKWIKIKNNAKKYQKASVAAALNDVDFAKKKEKGRDTMSSKQKEVLTQANKAKNSALDDTTSAIGQRMDDLASTDGLKLVVKLAKTRARVAANKTILKSADGEEAKQLKVKISKLEGQAAGAKTALADYESTNKEEPETTQPTPNGEEEQNTDNIKTTDKPTTVKVEDVKKLEAAEGAVTTAKAAYDKVKDGEDEKAKIEAEIAFKQKQQAVAKLKNDKELSKGLGEDIATLMAKKQELIKAGGKEVGDGGEGNQGPQGKPLAGGDEGNQGNQGKPPTSGEGDETAEQKAERVKKEAKDKKLTDLTTKLGAETDEEKKAEIQKEIDNVKQNESLLKIAHEKGNTYIQESVSVKFARLLNEAKQ